MKELESLQAEGESGSGCIIQGMEQTSSFRTPSRVSIDYECEQNPASILDTLYWVNPPALQSMPEINHAHMLVLRSDSVPKGEVIPPCPPL